MRGPLQIKLKPSTGGSTESATKVMGETFDAAIPGSQHRLRARIIEAAKSGERDGDKLRDWALITFGRKKG